MKLKKYPKYKDSGIEWIGEIPEEWEVRKLKNVSEVNPTRRIGSSKQEKDINFLPMDKVSEKGEFDKNSFEKYYKIKNGYTLFLENDVLIAKITPCFENGKGTLVKNLKYGYGFGSTEFHVIKSNNKIIPKFLFYITKDFRFRKMGFPTMKGAVGQKRISPDFIREFYISLPPLQEQGIIGDYLDYKTGRIDGLIRRHEQLVELFKEKRKSLINSAVIKGLDPNVKMKDSGIEWIGEIPEEWEVGRLKNYTKKIIDGTHFTPKYIGKGIPFLRVKDLKTKKIDLENVKYISKEENKILSSRCKPTKGDLLLSKNGTIGITKVVNWDFTFNIFVSICLIKLKKIVNPFFLHFYFHSDSIEKQIQFLTKTTSVTNLHLDKIREFYISLPPLEEQKSITEYLDKHTSKIDQSIQKVEKKIELLKEYRKSLINHVVTGKVDIRDMEIPDKEKSRC